MFVARLMGAGLVFTAFCMFGAFSAHRKEQRPREIRALVRGLELLRTEVSYGLTRLGPALESISDVLRSGDAPRIPVFFSTAATGLETMSARDAWEAAIGDLRLTGCLSEGEMAVLGSLGDSLGRSGSEDQLRRLDHAVTNLKAFQAEAQEEAARMGRVHRSAWGAVGGCIALLLL